jgi:hypothetical protein
MPKSTTPLGTMRELDKCYIDIPGAKKIVFTNLPDLGDSKQAIYNGEGIIGRSSPLHTYSHSDTRNISIQLHLFVLEQADIQRNLQTLRAIQSAAYPRPGTGGAPFLPPVICKIRCGDLLATEDLCCTLQQYSIKFPTDVAWDEDTYLPYKFDIDTSWQVVYSSSDLPNNSRIYNSGR